MARLLGVILLMCSCCATLRGWERERKEGRREEGREGGREEGRKGRREEGKKGGREEGREERRERIGGRKGETKMKYCYLYKVLAAEQNTVCTSTLPGEKSVAQIQHG